MQPSDCPSWDYADHRQRAAILPQRVADVLRRLAIGQIDALALALDSREVHAYVFRELTPKGYEYFAGHYRGEPYRCLKYLSVSVPSDPRVGQPP